eukprot:403368121
MESSINNKKLEILDQSSSGDNNSFDENDNKYTDPEDEDVDIQEDQEESNDEDSQQIDTSTALSSQRKQYKGNFSSTKDDEQYGCPYGACGRKFVSADILKQHIERRHAPIISPKKPQQLTRDQINMNVATPIQRKELQGQPQKRFEEDKMNQTKFGFFQAAPRPVTSHGRQNPQVSIQQANILKEMMGGNNQNFQRRPQTAATTTKKDEQRIKKKIMTLEAIERKIEEDIEEFNNRKKPKNIENGVRVTKALLLDASQCDELSQIQAVIVRDKNIEIFDDNKQDGFKLEDLVNCEAIYATHNLIKDIFGICQISTLVELNLSFNQISDIQPLEDLVLLQKLWLNRNHILVIDPIKSLTKLQVLGLFNNEIFNDKKALDVLQSLQNLQELSIDGNPISSQVKFKYELTMRLKKLEILDDDPIKELDRDIAEQFFIQNKLPLPGSGIIKKYTITSAPQQENVDHSQSDDNALKENHMQQQIPALKVKKTVKFSKPSIDDDGNTWQHDEIKKLEAKCAELICDNEEYKLKLQQRHFDHVYKENERLKMELKNMYILEEENKDLREELEQLKSLTYEEKVRQLVDENYNLKKRNGMLLIQVSELESKTNDLSRSHQDDLLDQQKNMRNNMNMARPSTSAGAFMRKKDDMMMVNEDFMELQESAQDDFDKELDDLIMKNQKRLAELQSEVKEVSKIVGEPVFNVRKIKSVRTVKAASKGLNIKPQQSQDRVKALGADLIDENDENN